MRAIFAEQNRAADPALSPLAFLPPPPAIGAHAGGGRRVTRENIWILTEDEMTAIVNEERLCELLAEICEVPVAEVSPTLPLAELGVDSLVALRFARQIHDEIGVEIELEWIYEYPTMRELTQLLREKCAAA